jgi:hypothetical protein
VHEEGYHVERGPGDDLAFRRPDGRVLSHVPSLAPVTTDPMAVICASNEAAGVKIDARTSMPAWLGERLDVVYAIDVLRPPGLPLHSVIANDD